MGEAVTGTAADRYAALSRALAQCPPAELDGAATLLYEATSAGPTLFTFVNGACEALASHVATDLGKGLAGRVRVVSLLTAYANDHDYDYVFEHRTIGMTGGRGGVDRFAAACDVVLRAPLETMEQIENDADVVVAGDLRGAHGRSGEVGHLVVVHGRAPCGCGRLGCVETIASAPASARRRRRLRPASPDAPLRGARVLGESMLT